LCETINPVGSAEIIRMPMPSGSWDGHGPFPGPFSDVAHQVPDAGRLAKVTPVVMNVIPRPAQDPVKLVNVFVVLSKTKVALPGSGDPLVSVKVMVPSVIVSAWATGAPTAIISRARKIQKDFRIIGLP